MSHQALQKKVDSLGKPRRKENGTRTHYDKIPSYLSQFKGRNDIIVRRNLVTIRVKNWDELDEKVDELQKALE